MIPRPSWNPTGFAKSLPLPPRDPSSPTSRAFDRARPSLIFILVWLVLPNLPFVGLWLTGGPIRTLVIILYLLIGLLARRLPYPVVAVLFVLTVAFDVLFVLSSVFNLSVISFLYAIEYAWTLRPFASATYVLFGGSLIVSTAAVLWLAHRFKSQFPDASITMIALGAGAIMAADTSINLTPEYSFGQLLSGAAPFDSAARRSGLMDELDSGERRNLLIVIVESWGVLKDPAERALVEAPFQRAAVTERYAIKTGVSPYYGSTTNGELRELCGQWGSFRDYLDHPVAGCLPARLDAEGYQTIAIHGFSGHMFDRDRWYPNIGFQEMRFAEQLWQPGERVCPGVFTGACDTDLADDVSRALTSANGTPHFVYWLTLNSHLPVHPDAQNQKLDCKSPDGPFHSEQVCSLAELWIEVFERIADVVAAPGLGPTDVLIVGDHAPPFWSHEGRSHFVPGEVPWILLRPRAG
jgi:Sulfatase